MLPLFVQNFCITRELRFNLFEYFSCKCNCFFIWNCNKKIFEFVFRIAAFPDALPYANCIPVCILSRPSPSKHFVLSLNMMRKRNNLKKYCPASSLSNFLLINCLQASNALCLIWTFSVETKVNWWGNFLFEEVIFSHSKFHNFLRRNCFWYTISAFFY